MGQTESPAPISRCVHCKRDCKKCKPLHYESQERIRYKTDFLDTAIAFMFGWFIH